MTLTFKSVFERARAYLAELVNIPSGPQIPLFTQSEWDRKWLRYVESVGREIAADSEHPYVFRAWIQRVGSRIALELSPAIMGPGSCVCRGVIPIPARPPHGTRQELDALCAALKFKLTDMVYGLDLIAVDPDTTVN